MTVKLYRYKISSCDTQLVYSVCVCVCVCVKQACCYRVCFISCCMLTASVETLSAGVAPA